MATTPANAAPMSAPAPVRRLDGPAVLACLRAEGIRTKHLAEASGLSYWHVSRILHGHEVAGWYASAHIRRALRALGVIEAEGNEEEVRHAAAVS